MTRVCLVGEDDLHLSYELLSRETAREALAAYDLREPYRNTVAVETVSLGAAVALLNDLDWYLVRFVSAALVLEPSVSDEEWLSRDLATAIRDGAVDPDETGRLLKVYGVEHPDTGASDPPPTDEASASGADDGDAPRENPRPEGDGERAGEPPRLVEPMFVARTGDTLPEYDLRDVDETLLVRVTEEEFKD